MRPNDIQGNETNDEPDPIPPEQQKQRPETPKPKRDRADEPDNGGYDQGPTSHRPPADS
jgi:hypothetical protein